MSTRPLVVFGDDWGRHVSSMQHLLRHLFDQYPTVWVNGIGHRVPGLRDAGRALQKLGAMLRPAAGRARAGNGVAVSWSRDGLAPAALVDAAVLPLHHWRGVEPLNRWSLTRAIGRALHRISDARPIVVTGSPPSVAVAGRLNEIATIYLCMDDWTHLPTVSPHMLLPLERRLLRHADAVVATARQLTQLKVPDCGTVHYLPQGVNYDHFHLPQAVPAELEQLPRPWIGFAGGVGPALDIGVLHAVAAAFPHGSVVLVGPLQDGLGTLAAPNIHHFGARPYAQLPAWVQSFDVGIIPYVRNPWTESVDPLKLLEYLAAGIPAVTTDLPEVHKYANVITIASQPDEFAAAVGHALAANGAAARAGREAVARANTWQARAAEFARIIDETLARKLNAPTAATHAAPHSPRKRTAYA